MPPELELLDELEELLLEELLLEDDELLEEEPVPLEPLLLDDELDDELLDELELLELEVIATVAVDVAVPPAPVAVRVYVVVAVGLTDLLVPVTVPTPWLMLRLVAPETVQLSSELWPKVIVAGDALKTVMLGGVGVTVTLASFVFVVSATLVART